MIEKSNDDIGVTLPYIHVKPTPRQIVTNSPTSSALTTQSTQLTVDNKNAQCNLDPTGIRCSSGYPEPAPRW